VGKVIAVHAAEGDLLSAGELIMEIGDVVEDAKPEGVAVTVEAMGKTADAKQ